MSRRCHRPASHSSERLRTGAVWSFVQSVGIGSIQFGAGILLARLLEPADFGVFIAVSAFSALFIAQVKFGLPEALIQTRSLESGQVAAAFWTMQAMALLATGVFVALAGWLQGVYADDRFVTIAILSVPMFFVVPVVAVGSALLKRDLDFKRLARVRVLSLLSTLIVTLPLALLGVGPASLVIGGLAGALVNAVLLARVANWRLRTRPTNIRPLFAYAWRSNLALTQQTATERVDNMLVGALAGTMTLGLYNRAFSLARMPLDQFGESVRDLIFSGLSRCQGDADRTVQLQYKLVCAVATVTYPFLLLFLFIAADFIHILYGEKWLPAALPLQVMIVGVFASTVSLTLYSLCAANNLVGRLAWLGFVQLLATIALVLVSAPFGLVAIATGIALRDLLSLWLLQRVVAGSHLTVRATGLLYAVAPALLATAAGALGAGVLTQVVTPPATAGALAAGFAHLVLAGLGVFGAYLAALLLIAWRWPDHAPLAATLSFFGGLLRRLLPGGEARRRAAASARN